MFNIYRKIRRQNLTMQKVAPITARESRRKRGPPTHCPPDKNINSVRRQNKRHKKSVLPILTTQNRTQNFHKTVTARRNRTEITTKSLRTFRKKHIILGATAVDERKKDRITPSESLKKSRHTAKNNKIEATKAENIITV